MGRSRVQWCSVFEDEEGLLTVSYSPIKLGLHVLSLTINGEQSEGDSFQCMVSKTENRAGRVYTYNTEPGFGEFVDAGNLLEDFSHGDGYQIKCDQTEDQIDGEHTQYAEDNRFTEDIVDLPVPSDPENEPRGEERENSYNSDDESYTPYRSKTRKRTKKQTPVASNKRKSESPRKKARQKNGSAKILNRNLKEDVTKMSPGQQLSEEPKSKINEYFDHYMAINKQHGEPVDDNCADIPLYSDSETTYTPVKRKHPKRTKNKYQRTKNKSCGMKAKQTLTDKYDILPRGEKFVTGQFGGSTAVESADETKDFMGSSEDVDSKLDQFDDVSDPCDEYISTDSEAFRYTDTSSNIKGLKKTKRKKVDVNKASYDDTRCDKCGAEFMHPWGLDYHVKHNCLIFNAMSSVKETDGRSSEVDCGETSSATCGVQQKMDDIACDDCGANFGLKFDLYFHRSQNCPSLNRKLTQCQQQYQSINHEQDQTKGQEGSGNSPDYVGDEPKIRRCEESGNPTAMDADDSNPSDDNIHAYTDDSDFSDVDSKRNKQKIINHTNKIKKTNVLKTIKACKKKYTPTDCVDGNITEDDDGVWAGCGKRSPDRLGEVSKAQIPPPQAVKLKTIKIGKAIHILCGIFGCRKFFPTTGTWREHYLEHREKIMGSVSDFCEFTCKKENCTKGYATQKELDIHVKAHLYQEMLLDMKKQWETAATGEEKTFSGDSLYNPEIFPRTYDKPAERKFVCEMCGRAFAKHSILTKHKETHTIERRFSCDICGFKFKTKGTYSNHVRRHLRPQTFVCETCGKSYTAAHSLKIHKEKHSH